jgi:hypothetical protein
MCWPTSVFVSPSHTRVGSFTMSVGPRGHIFAPSAGPHTPLFASPRVTVRKPLQIEAASGSTRSALESVTPHSLTLCTKWVLCTQSTRRFLATTSICNGRQSSLWGRNVQSARMTGAAESSLLGSVSTPRCSQALLRESGLLRTFGEVFHSLPRRLFLRYIFLKRTVV